MKNKLKKPQFPRNYLRITENKDFLQILIVFKKMTIVFIFAVLIIFILIFVFDLYKNFVKNQQVQTQRQKLTHEINIWKNFSEKYPNYKEVYFQIAVREYELGDFGKANSYLQKTLLLDPNYNEALKLQRILMSR